MSRVLLALAAGASAASLLIGLGLALTYLRLLGHLAGDGLAPSWLLPRLALACAVVATGAGLLVRWWARRWLHAPPSEGARSAWLALPHRAAAALAAGWVAAGLSVAVASILAGAPAATWQHLAVSVTLMPAAFAGAAAFFAFEAASRAHIERALPGGALDRLRLRLRTRLLLLLVVVPAVPVVALGLAFAHGSGADEASGHGHGHGTDADHASTAGAGARGVLVLSAAAGLVSVVFGALAAASLARPIVRLTAAMERLRGGDLDARVPVASADELGRAAEAFNAMAAGLAERAWLQETFGRYVSREVVEALRAGRVSLDGEQCTVTVLFADIRGFTRLTESMAPRDVLAFVNDYLRVMIAAVARHGGRVDKVMGDGMMVVFGAPVAHPDHARRAVEAALGMRAALADFNGARTARGEGPIRIGVGVHTGEVTAGAVGCEEHKVEYTVLGDVVNLASRIEGLTKELGADILVSEATRDAVGDELDARPMPPTEVRGKSEPVRTFAVDGLRAGPRPAR